NQLSSNQSQLSIEHDQLRSQQDHLKNNQSQLRSEHNQLRSDHSQISSNQSQLRSENNQLRSDHSQISSNQSQLRSEQGNLRNEYEQMRRNQNQLKSAQDRLTSKQNQQRSEHNQLRSEHDQLKLLMNATLNKMALLFPEKKKEKEYCGDWVKHASSCFLLSKDEKNWDQARKDCHVNNSDLFAAWIGLTDKKDEKNFVWVNGEGIKPDVTYWGHGEPNNALASWDATKAGQDCVGIVSPKTDEWLKNWDDIICSGPRHYICEKKVPRDGI
uniref:C-type lectin domain-containing protein n=1 Tax=Scophthalmus maximus TaxID=52904 RepID=A0A8D3CT90_SCOMX